MRTNELHVTPRGEQRNGEDGRRKEGERDGKRGEEREFEERRNRPWREEEDRKIEGSGIKAWRGFE